MKKIVFAALLPVLAGCLSSAPNAPTNWVIDFSRTDARAHFDSLGDSVRISLVDVRAPYTGQRLAVLRPDGSVAFDAFNVFACSPALLLRGAAQDEVQASGRFARVSSSASAAQVGYDLEIGVTQLALDCRRAGHRTAKVELVLTLLKGRQVLCVARGAGAESLKDAEDDYSVAFSAAFARAMSEALGALSIR